MDKSGNGNDFTEIDGTNIKLDAPVTATGDISASGKIIGDGLKITPTDTSEDTTHYVTFQ